MLPSCIRHEGKSQKKERKKEKKKGEKVELVDS
jgi:hypothetical protein